VEQHVEEGSCARREPTESLGVVAVKSAHEDVSHLGARRPCIDLCVELRVQLSQQVGLEQALDDGTPIVFHRVQHGLDG
jgi:hypothetical protein